MSLVWWDFYNRRSSVKIFNALRKRITASAQPCQSASSLPRHSLRMLLALSILLALLVACGDESSSSAPDPIGEISSSSNDDNGSSGKDKDAFSSSQKDSQKSSSSTAEKNSSSSVSGKNGSSLAVELSSSGVLHICDDGDTTTVEAFGEYIYETCRGGFWEADSTKSKSVVDSLAAIEKNKEHPDMDSLFAGYDGEYFEFEDPRDGHKYKYIEFHGYTDDIGSHATFYVMAENLNYGKMVPSGTTKFDDKVTEKLCYVDDKWFCDNHFGGLYTWAEAMNLPKVCDSVEVGSNDACKVFADSARSEEKARTIIWQGICPDGWHIMNKREWLYTRGDLRSKILWEKHAGNNETGLSIIPTGEWVYGGGFSGAREVYVLWLPVELNAANAIRLFTDSFTLYYSESSGEKNMFQPVRCVMDANNSLTED
jgi:uncharacterized protein (TIGR02145 family)